MPMRAISPISSRRARSSVIKRQLYDVPFQTLAEATIDANREMQVALKGSDFREGVASFMEKRPPRFTGK